MESDTIHHRAKIWRWGEPGKGSWHFLTIDGASGEALTATALMRRLETGRRRGFGSLRVTAQIGETRWQTSVFPKKGQEAWDIPIKKAICKAEDIGDGDEILIILEPC